MMHTFPRLAFGAFLALAGPVAIAQTPVAPPPKPLDSGPTLEVTLQFINDKLNAQGRVGYLMTFSNSPGLTMRTHVLYSDPGDAGSCILRSTATIEIDTAREVKTDSTGQSIPGHETHSLLTSTTTIPLKEIDRIVVEGTQEYMNRKATEDAHPERVATVTPDVFFVQVKASKKVVSIQTSHKDKDGAPKVTDITVSESGFRIRDGDTADRLAKALTHAVELCGGGNKDPF
jgi:hypothetical protein